MKKKHALQSTEMAIVPSSSAAIGSISRFTVPEHWVIEDRRRTSGKSAGLLDRYYYEPETGLKFRSKRSIEKYLIESEGKSPTLKMLEFDKKGEFTPKRKIATVTRKASLTRKNSSFRLPEDWLVEECVRSSGLSAGRVDKYYHDPETGLRFRSMKTVEEYLTGLKDDTPRLKMLPFDEKKELQQKRRKTFLSPATKTTSLELPEGWVVEEYVRTCGYSAGRVVKHFIEPGTRRKFLSHKSVQKHLAELDGSPPIQKDSIPDNYNAYCSEVGTGLQLWSQPAVEGSLNEGNGKVNKAPPTSVTSGDSVMSPQHSSSGKNKVCDLKKTALSFSSANVPAKIKWAFSGNGEDAWNPFVGESIVPEFVQRQWAKIFVSIVNEEILMHKFKSL